MVWASDVQQVCLFFSFPLFFPLNPFRRLVGSSITYAVLYVSYGSVHYLRWRWMSLQIWSSADSHGMAAYHIRLCLLFSS